MTASDRKKILDAELQMAAHFSKILTYDFDLRLCSTETESESESGHVTAYQETFGLQDADGHILL